MATEKEVFDAIETRVRRLYDAASIDALQPLHRQYSGGRMLDTNKFEDTRHLRLRLSVEVEDQLRVVEDRGVRAASTYRGVSVRRKSDLSIALSLIQLSSRDGGNRRLGLNTLSQWYARGDSPIIQYLPHALLCEGASPSASMSSASNDAIGLFRTYTAAFEGMLQGQPIAEALGALVLPEFQLAGPVQFQSLTELMPTGRRAN